MHFPRNFLQLPVCTACVAATSSRLKSSSTSFLVIPMECLHLQEGLAAKRSLALCLLRTLSQPSLCRTWGRTISTLHLGQPCPFYAPDRSDSTGDDFWVSCYVYIDDRFEEASLSILWGIDYMVPWWGVLVCGAGAGGGGGGKPRLEDCRKQSELVPSRCISGIYHLLGFSRYAGQQGP